ncbi:MAG: hypothetical protein ACPGVA_14635 [Pikeienuella sp.]
MYRTLILGLFALSAAACAQPATVGSMATGDLALNTPANSPLLEGVCVSGVTGGQATNPLWVSKVDDNAFAGALRASLLANGLSAPENDCAFALTAELASMKQPLIGISMTVTANVNYAVQRAGAAQPDFTTNVTLPFTAKFSDAAIGAIRLRVANEGAIRVNIESMLRELAASPLAAPVPAPAGEDETVPSS